MLDSARYDKKPGMMGKTQGLKKDANPAKSAIARFTILKDEILPPALVPRCSESRTFVRAWKFAILLSSPVKIKIPRIMRRTPKTYST